MVRYPSSYILSAAPTTRSARVIGVRSARRPEVRVSRIKAGGGRGPCPHETSRAGERDQLRLRQRLGDDDRPEPPSAHQLDSRTLTIRARIRLTARTVTTGEGSGRLRSWPASAQSGSQAWQHCCASTRRRTGSPRSSSRRLLRRPALPSRAIACGVLGGTTVAALDRSGRRVEQLRLPVGDGNMELRLSARHIARSQPRDAKGDPAAPDR